MCKKIVQIKNLAIGEGIPKVCVPITGVSREEILSMAERIACVHPDLVEWRADFYEDIMDTEKTKELLADMDGALGSLPLLFTFRSAAEGGECDITPEEYALLNLQVAEQKIADLIDVECFMKGLDAAELIRQIHKQGRAVIASNHHFHETPENEVMAGIFRDMERDGADILKLAVMPGDRRDVLRLLAATEVTLADTCRPVITMAMGSLGTISRVCGETFGSCVTYASAGKASAPGQLDIHDVRAIQEIFHRAQ